MIPLKPSGALNDREVEIISLLARGMSNQEIAENCSMSLRAVKYYTGRIYAKLGVRSRAAAIVWAWQHRAMRE